MIQSEVDGCYYIISEVSGLALDLKNAKTKDGQNIQQYARNGSGAKKWEIVKDKDAESKAPEFGTRGNEFIK